MKTTFVRLACCALMLTGGAGCWNWVPPDPNTTSGTGDGVSSVNVEDCGAQDALFPAGEQFSVYAKPASSSTWTFYAQLWGGSGCPTSSVNIPLDQPGQWQVAAIGILANENCNTGPDNTTLDTTGCSDVRSSLYQQNPEGPSVPWQLYDLD